MLRTGNAAGNESGAGGARDAARIVAYGHLDRRLLLQVIERVNVDDLRIIATDQEIATIEAEGELGGSVARAQGCNLLIRAAIKDQHAIVVPANDEETIASRVGEDVHESTWNIDTGSALIGFLRIDQEAHARGIQDGTIGNDVNRA